MLKRLFDIILSLIVLMIFSPIFLILAILIKLESEGPVFFMQERVGKNGKLFMMHKFRSMYIEQSSNSALTIGEDLRITKVGRYIRKLHLDEVCQTIDVLKGNMSLVGPRPEIAKYINFSEPAWKDVLNVRPGITGLASVLYSKKEYAMLSASNNPEDLYLNKILPAKLKLEKFYVDRQSFLFDVHLVYRTIRLVLQNLK